MQLRSENEIYHFRNAFEQPLADRLRVDLCELVAAQKRNFNSEPSELSKRLWCVPGQIWPRQPNAPFILGQPAKLWRNSLFRSSMTFLASWFFRSPVLRRSEAAC